MSSRTENIKFNVYLNDKMAGNNMNSLRRRSRELNSEMNKLTIGSAAWIRKMKELQSTERRMKNVRSQVQKTNGTLTKLADGFNKYFALIGATIAGITAAVMGLRKVSDTISEFEKGIANVTTLLSEADKLEFKSVLEKGSIQLIKEYGFAIQDTSKALFDAVSAGVPAGDAVQFLNTSSRLAIGGVTTLGTSVDGLTTVINAWKLEMDEADTVSEAFFSAQKEGKTTVAELSASIGKIAPVAALAGISYQEVMSAMAALTKQGIKTAESSTYLRGAINGLIAPSAQAEQILRDLGVPVGITEIRTAGFTETLKALNAAIVENPDVISKAIPNIRGMQAAVALTGEGMVEFERILENVNNDIGNNSSLSKAFNEQQLTMSQMMAKAGGRMKATAIELSDTLLPVMRNIFSAMRTFNHLTVKSLTWIRDNGNIISTFANILKILIAAWAAYRIQLTLVNAQMKLGIKLKGLLNGLALRASFAYNTLTGNLTRAAAAQRLLNTTAKANPYMLLVSALVAVGTALYTFSRNAKSATEEQKRLNDEVEYFQKLQQDAKGIKEQAAVVDSMNETQLRRFLSNVKYQKEASNDYTLERIALEKKMAEAHQRALDWVAQMDVDDATRKEILARESTWHIRDEYIAQIAKVKEKEEALDVEQLARWEEMAQKKLDLFEPEYPDIPPILTNNVDETPSTAEEENAYKKLYDFITKTRNDIELANMSSQQKEVEQVKLKYAQLYEEAEGNTEIILELKRLENLEIDAIDAEHNTKKEEEKAAFLQKLKEMSYSDQEEELEANRTQFQNLIDLANQYGVDATKLKEQMKASEAAINQKYLNAELEAEKAHQKAKRDLQINTMKSNFDVMAQTTGNIMGLLDENSNEYKALAVFQATLNSISASLSAYASAIEVPIVGPVLAPIAAASAFAFGMAQVAKIESTKKENTSTPRYDKGGIARGSKHNQGGIHLIDSKTGDKVGEMEDNEPYMILSDNTYKNNKSLIDQLLYNSQNLDGAAVEWSNISKTPVPDFDTINSIASNYENGGIINTLVKSQTTTNNTSVKTDNMEHLLTLMLSELQKDKPVIIDQDNQLKLRDSIKMFDQIERSSGTLKS